ncbi:MAG: YdcF family protein [Nanoarchaeota archaeon]|nr:YdcF family protein [Nanoarchaeota archaeon]
MENTALVAVFGYDQNPQLNRGYKDWRTVANSRIIEARRLIEFFNKHGIKADLLIVGGKDYNGKNEADAMYDLAKKNGLNEIVERTVLDYNSKNTSDNAKATIRYALEKNYPIVSVVTSPDHSPRALRDLVYNQPRIDKRQYLLSVTPAEEPYSTSGLPPIIIEPPSPLYMIAKKLESRISQIDLDPKTVNKIEQLLLDGLT